MKSGRETDEILEANEIQQEAAGAENAQESKKTHGGKREGSGRKAKKKGSRKKRKKGDW